MTQFHANGIVTNITEPEQVTDTLTKQIVTIADEADGIDPTREPRTLAIEFVKYTQQNGIVRDYTKQLEDVSDGMPVCVYFTIKHKVHEGRDFHNLKGIRITENS